MPFLKRVFPLGLLSIALGSTFAPAYADTTAREHNLIHLQAEASREVQNDQIIAIMYTELNDNSPTKLAQETTRIINDAMLKAKNYPSVTVSTGSQNTSPIYNDRNKLTGWRSRAEVRLKSTDIKAASELIAEMQNTMQLDNVVFNVSKAQQDKVENELVLDATRAFRERAQALQKAWGATSYELVEQHVNTSVGEQPLMRTMMTASKSMFNSAAPQQMESGSSRIQVTTSGTVQLK